MANTYAAALRVVETLRAAGHTAYLAGGCVRDRLLGREPKDYDVASSATPAQVQALFTRTEAVGAAFGVVLVLLEGQAVEVATFRDDGEYRDGRRPESVTFSTPARDAARRDFTVNGMFLDPETGAVLDLVGGSADLERRRLRAIGDPLRRFTEDRLRILRLARFAAELGFEVDGPTLEAARACAAGVAAVSAERVQAELTRLLTAPGRVRGLELLDSLGLVALLLPELEACKGCAQPPQFHPEGDVWRHTLLTLGALERPAPALAWAALLHDIGKPPCFSQAEGDRIRFNGHEGAGADMARAVCRRLKMGGDLAEAVEALVRDHLRLSHPEQMRQSTLKRLLRRADFADLLELTRADCVASHGDLSSHAFCLKALADFEAQGRQQALKPQALLTGRDLIGLGYRPGPAFKAMLAAVEDEQLEGRLTDHDQAVAWVKAAYPDFETPKA